MAATEGDTAKLDWPYDAPSPIPLRSKHTQSLCVWSCQGEGRGWVGEIRADHRRNESKDGWVPVSVEGEELAVGVGIGRGGLPGHGPAGHGVLRCGKEV